MSFEFTDLATPYVLPNGCVLEPGGRVRLGYDQLFAIPHEDIERYGLDLDHTAYSAYSEVVTRRAV